MILRSLEKVEKQRIEKIKERFDVCVQEIQHEFNPNDADLSKCLDSLGSPFMSMSFKSFEGMLGKFRIPLIKVHLDSWMPSLSRNDLKYELFIPLATNLTLSTSKSLDD